MGVGPTEAGTSRARLIQTVEAALTRLGTDYIDLLQLHAVDAGARNDEQLRQNLGAVGWSLDAGQIARLDAASAVTPSYPRFPYYRQAGFARLDPPAV